MRSCFSCSFTLWREQSFGSMKSELMMLCARAPFVPSVAQSFFGSLRALGFFHSTASIICPIMPSAKIKTGMR